jgi:hypothetical protein
MKSPAEAKRLAALVELLDATAQVDAQFLEELAILGGESPLVADRFGPVRAAAHAFVNADIEAVTAARMYAEAPGRTQ